MCAVGMESSHQILWSGSPQCRHAFLPRQRSRDEAAFQKPLLDRLKSGLTRLKPTATFPVDFLNDSKENEPGKVPPSRPPGTACLALCRGLALSAGHSGPTTGGVPSASRAHKACVGKQRLLLTGCLLFSRDTSGQGRFCTIFRSYSRGAQGVVLVYDIANRWSFDGLGRWITEVNQHAPGVPKILVGNRLHLAFKRQVPTEQAQAYAERLGVTFFEVSPLCNFNITESFTELARTVLLRHGMDRLWRPSKVLSLQDLCCRAVVSCTPVHLVDRLPLPVALRGHLKSFSMASGLNARMMHGRSYSLTTCSGCKRTSLRKAKAGRPPQSPPRRRSRNGCRVS
ncbi:ras-related protein Rab-40B isoform X3 [Sus scrofa]|uniref:small monomeric GTPase n=2 Tax=Sus scrofa TaxID=9823 RepID=A0A5G2RFY7_PIG|nr:ras-related protein Rab-40B isoform X3 [Sus scrofa]XP_020921990.1 ras-related protein Rab-40B isoform X3 [Sus scrofa]